MDYEHFATEASNNGQLLGNLWTAYHGKATEVMVPVPELVQRVAAGGGLVYGTQQSAFALSSTDGSPFPLTRRMAVVPAITKPVIVKRRILPVPIMAVTTLPSKSLVALLLAILSSLPTERKIALFTFTRYQSMDRCLLLSGGGQGLLVRKEMSRDSSASDLSGKPSTIRDDYMDTASVVI